MKNNTKVKKEIPIVFATDDNYAPFLGVALKSILETSSKDNFFSVYILNTNVSTKNVNALLDMQCDNMNIEFVDVTKKLDSIGSKLPLRDYYTNTIYYRIFISSLFPEYDKMLYLDCDIIALTDIAELFNIELNDNLMGVIAEDVMANFDIFGKYSEEVLDINRYKYFNSGILLMNTKALRNYQIETKFVNILNQFTFKVAPDQDYLNVLCVGKVKHIEEGWNKAPIPFDNFNENDLKLVHYKINWKPWHYSNVKFERYFWENAKKTSFYNELKNMLANYGENQIEKDNLSFENLVKTATKDIQNSKNYKNAKHTYENIDIKEENIYSSANNNLKKYC